MTHENKLPVSGISLGIIGLFRADYSLSIHGRQAARQLNQNQKTVQNCLNLLADNNILTFENDGKNKLFQLNKSSILAKNYLMLAERFSTLKLLGAQPHIQDISKLVCREKRIAIIFGECLNPASHDKTKDLEKDIDDTIKNTITDIIIDVIVIGPEIPNLTEQADSLPVKVRIMQATNAEFISQLKAKSSLAANVARNHILLSGIEPFVEYLLAFYYV